MYDESQLLDLPLLPLRDVVIYPHMVIPLFVGREKSIHALETALAASKQIFRGERGDFLVVRGERCPAGHTALLEAVVLAGHPLKSGQPVSSARARCRTDLLGLRRRVLAADGAPPPAPKLSPRLRELRDRAARNAPSAHRPAWI